jgi:hypothetical protein
MVGEDMMAISNLIKSGVFLVLLSASLVAAQSVQGQQGLGAYASCVFVDGLQIVQTDLLPTSVTSRPVETAAGERSVALEARMRIMFAYPDSDFFANVKAERLPAAEYPDLKKVLMSNFDFMSHGNTVNAALHSPMNGLEVYGLDREKLEGGVLGIYLLFDDPTHTVTTIYLLNQEPQSRKFNSMDEYRTLRDRFLAAYTGCIRKNFAHAK